MKDASLLSAVSEVLSLHYLFSGFGLADIIVKTEASEAEAVKEDFAVEMAKDVTAAKVARQEMSEAAGTVEEAPEIEQKGRKENKN